MKKLVKKARRGNQQAFTELIKTYEEDLYRTAKSILKKDSDCADAIQETIIKVYKKLPTLREPSYFKTWMTRILINECRSMLKLRKKVIPVEQFYTQHHTHEHWNEVELKEIIEELDQKLKVTVTLYYIQDFKTHEISEILDIPQGTVKSRLAQARKELSKALKQQERGGLHESRSNGSRN